MAMCPAARDFFVRQGDLTQKYFVYFKSNQHCLAEKDTSIGYVDIFQTSPKQAIDILVKAQQDCEELYISEPQAKLTALPEDTQDTPRE